MKSIPFFVLFTLLFSCSSNYNQADYNEAKDLVRFGNQISKYLPSNNFYDYEYLYLGKNDYGEDYRITQEMLTETTTKYTLIAVQRAVIVKRISSNSAIISFGEDGELYYVKDISLPKEINIISQQVVVFENKIILKNISPYYYTANQIEGVLALDSKKQPTTYRKNVSYNGGQAYSFNSNSVNYSGSTVSKSITTVVPGHKNDFGTNSIYKLVGLQSTKNNITDKEIVDIYNYVRQRKNFIILQQRFPETYIKSFDMR